MIQLSNESTVSSTSTIDSQPPLRPVPAMCSACTAAATAAPPSTPSVPRTGWWATAAAPRMRPVRRRTARTACAFTCICSACRRRSCRCRSPSSAATRMRSAFSWRTVQDRTSGWVLKQKRCKYASRVGDHRKCLTNVVRVIYRVGTFFTKSYECAPYNKPGLKCSSNKPYA